MESGEFRLILALFTSFFIIGALGIVLNVTISEVLIRREETLVLNYALIDTSNLLKRFQYLLFFYYYYQLSLLL